MTFLEVARRSTSRTVPVDEVVITVDTVLARVLEDELQELIGIADKNGGFVYITVQKLRNELHTQRMAHARNQGH